MWVLRNRAPEFLRQPDPPGPGGPLMRGCADITGSGGAARFLPAVRQGEAGAAGLAGRQSLLHEAVSLFCGTAVPRHEYHGRGQGRASGLAHDEGIGATVHDGATPANRRSGSEGD